MMDNKGAVTYTFGPFRLEVERNRLLYDGEPVQLRRKSYEILLLLVNQPGEIITKEEIISTVWPDQVVEENNLTQQIYKLRRVLGDTPKDQNYILTVPGKGYLFNKSVQKEYHLTTSSKVEKAAAPQPTVEAESGPPRILAGRLPAEGLAARWLAAGRLLAGRLSAGGLSAVWQRALLAAAILLVITGLGGLISLIVSRYSAGSKNGIQPRVTPFATLQGIESFPKFSPDGKFLAFTSEGDDEYNLDVYIKMVNQGETIRVTSHPDDDEQAVWSPDGRRLAFLRKSRRFGEPYKLITVSPLGGPEQEIAQVLGGLDWSPDGQHFAVSSNEGNGTSTGIYLISVDGREKRLVSNPVPPEIVYDTYPVFSPDGKRIAFVRWSAEQVGELNIINLENGSVRQITSDKKRITALRWAPDNRNMLFVSNRNGNQRLWRIPINGGEATMINSVPGEIEHFDLLRDGKMLAYTQMLNDTTIQVDALGDRQSTPGLKLPCTINSSRTDDTPEFSPDGSRLAFISNRSGWDEIWLASQDCTHATQLTDFKEVGLGSQSWSPNGQEITFDRYHNGQSQIFVISADGSQLRQITSDPAGAFMPSWSADGKWIYFTSLKFGISQIWRIPAAGNGPTAPVRITENQGRNAQESGDGRYLYYTRFDRLFRKDLQTGTESPIQELSSFVVGRYWTLAQNQIFFITQRFGTNPLIQQYDIDTGSIRKIREIEGYLSRYTPGLVVTSDLKLMAYSYISYRLGDIMLIEGWN